MTLNELRIIDKTKYFVQKWMTNEFSGHDFYHVMRVYETAIYLADGLNVDEFIVHMAALLHDVDDPKLRKPHAKIKHAVDFMNSIKLPQDQIDLIMDIIDNMSYSAHLRGQKVRTLEGKIVQDADRLDAIGAIGIARAFAYGGHKNRIMFKNDIDDDSSIAHFYQKLLKLPKLMNTPKAKVLAKAKMKTMKAYLKAFHQEFDQPHQLIEVIQEVSE
ncbi:MAG: phosphohydrolase [Tenericutes bacterium HGW-Tenericutes-1]|jgi:uncharacterized protein|nr:MAG: phosphohydrolase [Tenericutes bacterium HGW-Tenericutes-1]